MSAPMPRRTSRDRGLAYAAGLILLTATTTGCLNINAYVSSDFARYVEEVPLNADRPIARELRFVFADGNRISGLGGSTRFLVTTNESSGETLQSRGLRYIHERYPGIEAKHFQSTSALQEQVFLQTRDLAAPGRAALDKSSAGESLSAREQGAAATFEASARLDQAVGLMNASLAATQALDALVKAWHASDGHALASWVRSHTGAIGDSAPEGSVLYVDFVRVLSAQSFTTSSNTDFVVSARLERPGRKTLHAVRGMEYSVSTGEPPPASQLAGLTDYRAAKAPLLERPAMQSIKNITYAFEHATLANAAIADLYRQLGLR